jgi:hypothetical protein
MTSPYCYINYQSNRSPNDQSSYAFWFASSLIKIVADKPFGRGDIVELKEIKKISPTEWIISCIVLGDPLLDLKVQDFVENLEQEEIPTLMFVTTKIYLNSNSDIAVYSTDNCEILLNCTSILDNNKSCTIAALVKGKQAKIFGIDNINKTKFEWLLTSGL